MLSNAVAADLREFGSLVWCLRCRAYLALLSAYDPGNLVQGPRDASWPGPSRAARWHAADGVRGKRRAADPRRPGHPAECVVILSWNMPGLRGLLSRAKDFSYRR